MKSRLKEIINPNIYSECAKISVASPVFWGIYVVTSVGHSVFGYPKLMFL